MTFRELSTEFKKISTQLDFLESMQKMHHSPVKGVSDMLTEAQDKFEEVIDAFCEGWIAFRRRGGKLE